MPVLIINADDWGMSRLFNKGIFELAGEGLVTSTTVLVRQPFLEASLLHQIPQLSVGLHLDLPENSSENDIEEQINLFEDFFGKMPSHLDGHQHCHLRASNLPLVIKQARKFNLPIRSRYPQDRQIIKDAGLKTPDTFISWHPNRQKKLLDTLNGFGEGTAEMVCHPGYYDKHCSYKYNERRQQELFFLTSPAFKNALKKFNLRNYVIGL